MTFFIVCLYHQNLKLHLNCEICIFGEKVNFCKIEFKKFIYVEHTAL